MSKRSPSTESRPPKATLLAEDVAELFVAGRCEEASAWMPLAQLYTALSQARSTERLHMTLSDIQGSGLPDK